MNTTQAKKLRQMGRRVFADMLKAKPWYVPMFMWRRACTKAFNNI